MSRVDRYEYEDWKGFGARIKKYREQIGLSIEKFAEMINRSENFVAYIEKGKTGGSVHTLHQISKALKVSTDSLLYDQNMKDNSNEKNIYKQQLLEIINRCNDEELKILNDVAIAIFPNFQKILKEKNNISGNKTKEKS